MRGSVFLALPLLAAASGANGSALADEPAGDDALVALLLEATPGRAPIFEDALALRGASGLAALARVRDGSDVQRGWLAEAYAARIAARPTSTSGRSGGAPSADHVLEVVLGSLPGQDPVAVPLQRRSEIAAEFLRQGEGRALAWVERFADDPFLAAGFRLEAARALLRAEAPGAIQRLERALDETKGAGAAFDFVEEAVATRWIETVPFLMRVCFGKTLLTPLDALQTARADAALARVEGLDGFAAARESALELLLRCEAESAAARHSAGAAAGEGWRVVRGRVAPDACIVACATTQALPPGRLLARFRWRVDGVADTQRGKRLALEVAYIDPEGHEVTALVMPLLAGPDDVGTWTATDVPFDTPPEPMRVEARVRWLGGCDAVVDRIDLMGVRALSDADRAAWPPRTREPWVRRAPPPLTASGADALFDVTWRMATAERPAVVADLDVPGAGGRGRGIALAAGGAIVSAISPRIRAVDSPLLPRPGRWTVLREVLLADDASDGALARAIADGERPDRAWLADAWSVRRLDPAAWARSESDVAAGLASLLAALPVNDKVDFRQSRFGERALAEGRTALPVNGLEPPALRDGFRWADELIREKDARLLRQWTVLLPRLGEAPPDTTPSRLDPKGPLRSVFAEQWLTGRPGPLPAVILAGGVSPMEDEGAQIPSTVGPLRLHALAQLGWLGEPRARRVLEQLSRNQRALSAERATAHAALLSFGR